MGKVCELFITHIAINWFGCGYNGCLRVSIGCVEREGRYLDSEHKKTGAKAPVFVFLIGF
ncbi:hypothetical protein EBN99_13765 [Vibrio parahaemolyticus]|nr:hypothetical protein [Vibrio parahaemolyticus]TOG39994.1 hypothetical protein CGJ02_18145 [Vibrio parahaemolyticus]